MAVDDRPQELPDSERLAWLRPLVYEMRDRLRTIELSRFWQVRNAFFALKQRLGFSAAGAWKTFEIPAAYRAVLEAADPYAGWRTRNDPRPSDLAEMRRISRALATQPTFSIWITGSRGSRFDATMASLSEQVYERWRPATIAGPACDFVVFLMAGDRLSPDALFAFAVAIAGDSAVDIVYGDEDTIDARGDRSAPQFKPAWSPETLLSRNYIGNAVAYRRTLAERAGVARALEPNERYDLTLRATEEARHIAHVPRIVYHSFENEHPPDASESEQARRAIGAALERRGERGSVASTGATTFVVRYAIVQPQRVSILIPSRDHAEDLDRCLRTLFERTTYADFEVLLIDNGTRERAAVATIARWRARDSRLRVLRRDEPFNYSRLNNSAAREASGTYLVLLNNDTAIVTPDWLEAMIEQAQHPPIGAVGAHLLYPDGFVQHGGVVLGIGGVAGHSFRGYPPGAAGYLDGLKTATNYSAVTAACLMVRKELYEAVGGLDEHLRIAFNDVDFCLRLGRAGYRNVWLPHVFLEHGESRSRGHDIGLAKTHRSLREARTMLERWSETIADDPYYSPHLTRLDESYGLR